MDVIKHADIFCVGLMRGMICAFALLALVATGCAPAQPATTQPVVQTASVRPHRRTALQAPSSEDGFDITLVPGRIHVVQPNDTLWSLAQRYYGNGKHWRKILVANRNRLTNSTDLPVGMKLIIP